MTAAPTYVLTNDPAEAADALLGAFESAWNQHDMAAMAELMTRDVHWVNTVGMHWQGRDEVHRAHAAFHAGMFKTVAIQMQEVESVTSVDDHVAVAVCRTVIEAFNSPTGPRPSSRDRLTVVIQQTPAGWLIAHGANVPILEQAQAHDPGKKPS